MSVRRILVHTITASSDFLISEQDTNNVYLHDYFQGYKILDFLGTSSGIIFLVSNDPFQSPETVKIIKSFTGKRPDIITESNYSYNSFNKLIRCGNSNRIYTSRSGLYSDDDGETWQEYDYASSGNMSGIAYVPSQSKYIMIASNTTLMVKESPNGVDNWTQVTVNTPPNASVSAASDLAILTNNRIITALFQGAIAYTDNFGVDWTTVNVAAGYSGSGAGAILYYPAQNMAILDSGGLFFVSTTGSSWSNANPPGDALTSGDPLYIDRINNKILWAAENVSFYESTNGTSWTKVQLTPSDSTPSFTDIRRVITFEYIIVEPGPPEIVEPQYNSINHKVPTSFTLDWNVNDSEGLEQTGWQLRTQEQPYRYWSVADQLWITTETINPGPLSSEVIQKNTFHDDFELATFNSIGISEFTQFSVNPWFYWDAENKQWSRNVTVNPGNDSNEDITLNTTGTYTIEVATTDPKIGEYASLTVEIEIAHEGFGFSI